MNTTIIKICTKMHKIAQFFMFPHRENALKRAATYILYNIVPYKLIS